MRLTVVLLSAALTMALPAMGGDKSLKTHQSKHSSRHMSSSGQSASMHESTRLSKVLDAEVKSSDGKELGDIEDVVLDPQSGKIRFAVISQGGVLGIGADHVAIPWNALNHESESEFTVNVDQERMKSAPKLEKDYANLNDPSYSASLDQFFGSSSSGVGASESPDGQQSSQSGAKSDKDKAHCD